MPNIHPITGIAFGTIYLNNIDADVASWLWDRATNISYVQACKDIREEVTRDVRTELEEADSAGVERPFDEEREIERRVDKLTENLDIDEPYLEGEAEGVKYGISHLGGAALLWIYESPYTGLYRQCSPCVPGAGDLDSPADPFHDKVGVICYDVPPDWREQKPEEPTEELCGQCNGSGEGLHDGTRCGACKGLGVIKDKGED